MSESNERTDELQVPEAKPQDEEISVEELEDVAGGATNNGCTNYCKPN